MTGTDRALVVLLRLIGAAEAAAAVFVVAPAAWMAAVHDRLLGLGPLPDAPVVGYTARHLSAVYVMHGVLAVAVARDVTRYRPLAVLLGWCHVGLGVTLACIDLAVGFPWVWAAAEGGVVTACGVLVVALGRQRAAPGRVRMDGTRPE